MFDEDQLRVNFHKLLLVPVWWGFGFKGLVFGFRSRFGFFWVSMVNLGAFWASTLVFWGLLFRFGVKLAGLWTLANLPLVSPSVARVGCVGWVNVGSVGGKTNTGSAVKLGSVLIWMAWVNVGGG